MSATVRPADEAWGTPAALESALLVLLGTGLGALLGVALLHTLSWWPGLVASLTGPSPKASWYLSRAAGLVAYALLSLSVATGLLLTGKLGRAWPGGPTVADLHQYSGLLGLALTGLHVGVLLGDRYIGYTPLQLLVPFGSGDYRPLWVGLGQLAWYLGLLVYGSSLARRLIGYRAWRALHGCSFAAYLLATAHGLAAGSDSGQPVVLFLYSLSGLSILFLTSFRVLTSLGRPRPAPR
jgi:predicted ferric reductase